MISRKSELSRKTAETEISISLNLDGEGKYEINTGVGFFDHMLCLMTKHGLFDVNLSAKGDLYIDCHHTIEDIGIVIGQCISKALGDKKGIKRYGTSFVPMDETLAMVSMDLSGRSYLVFDAEFTCEKIGEFDTEMVAEFFRAVAFNAGITLHMEIVHGKNNHHMAEGLFKAFGRALCDAVQVDNRIKGIMSTKGSI